MPEGAKKLFDSKLSGSVTFVDGRVARPDRQMPAAVSAAKKRVIEVGLNLEGRDEDDAAGGLVVGTGLLDNVLVVANGAGGRLGGRLGRGTSSSASKKNWIFDGERRFPFSS